MVRQHVGRLWGCFKQKASAVPLLVCCCFVVVVVTPFTTFPTMHVWLLMPTPLHLLTTLLLLVHSCRYMQVGFFDDKVGPITLACIVMITLLAITVMAFIDVFS